MEDVVPINFLLSVFSGIEINLFSFDSIICITIICFLLVSSAFVSASEVAYFSLSYSDRQKINNENVHNLLKNPNRLLATILVVNNFINVGIVVVTSYFTSIAIKFPKDSMLELIFQFVVITFLLLLFGEILPKVYANNNAVAFSNRMSKLLVFLNKLVYPISFLLLNITKFIDAQLKARQEKISVEDISKALDITEHESKENERRILRSIVEFGNIDVKEIMKSRVDIAAIDKSFDFKSVLEIILRSGFSRIPVFDQQIDKVVGILYIKDLLPHLDEHSNFSWYKLCRPAYFVPETKMINDLLKEFQSKKNHLAIVVDEYGGTSGLVTLEDVLEEIVGEINDEFDIEENIYSVLDKSNYIFDGKISLNDFSKIVRVDTDFFDSISGEFDTLAGLVLELHGSMPKLGAVCQFASFTFKVESADLRRIKRLKVTIDAK